MKSLIEIVLFFVPHFSTEYIALDFDYDKNKFIPVFLAKFLEDTAEDSDYHVAKFRSLDFIGISFFVELVSEIMTYEEYKREITKNDA